MHNLKCMASPKGPAESIPVLLRFWLLSQLINPAAAAAGVGAGAAWSTLHSTCLLGSTIHTQTFIALTKCRPLRLTRSLPLSSVPCPPPGFLFGGKWSGKYLRQAGHVSAHATPCHTARCSLSRYQLFRFLASICARFLFFTFFCCLVLRHQKGNQNISATQIENWQFFVSPCGVRIQSSASWPTSVRLCIETTIWQMK